MCGRYVLRSGPRRWREQFDAGSTETLEWRPRYNLAPSQYAPVLRLVDGQRHIDLLRWGLLPAWAKDESFAYRTVNARCETVATLPAFRAAMRARRCVVPADGFYEWQLQPDGKSKQPYFIDRRDGRMLAFAGLWESWKPPGGGDALLSFTIITTPASRWMAPLHERMPALLDAQGVEAWLQPAQPAQQLQALLHPAPEDALQARPVSRAVGNPRNDGPELLQAAVS